MNEYTIYNIAEMLDEGKDVDQIAAELDLDEEYVEDAIDWLTED